jgi:hypothetical protein
LLAHQARQIRLRSFGRSSATTHQADPVAAPLCFLEIQSARRGLHFLLQGCNRFDHCS